MYKLYCRIYQNILKLSAYFLPWRRPILLEGENSLKELPKIIKSKGLEHLLIIASKTVSSLGLMDSLTNGLKHERLNFVIYDKTIPDPTIDNVEEAFQLYQSHNCQGIIAFGGGSPIDCAKVVGARVARPNKSIRQMKGLLKIRKKTPPLFVIPTTAGTGSEVSVAAVISNPETHEKYALNDMVLIPEYAILDPLLTVSLSPQITATTGMDAFTHAVEAYIGKSNTTETKKFSQAAIRLIFENLFEAYINSNNLVARANMQKASYYAGVAFTRAYVGYVHAIAHPLGGFYKIPHGLANAVILPYVLEFYGRSAHPQLANLADLIGIGASVDNIEQKAAKFIATIRELNKKMGIPAQIDGILERDIPSMVDRAFKESNPLYPVPKIMSKEDFLKIYQMIKK